jgi:chromosome segregation ATPase
VATLSPAQYGSRRPFPFIVSAIEEIDLCN